MFDKCLQDAIPILSQRRLTMARHRDSPVVCLPAGQVCDFDLFKLNLVIGICLLLDGFELAQFFDVLIVDLHLTLYGRRFFLGFLAK